MALVEASPLAGAVGKVYGCIVLDQPSAVSLFISFTQKYFARCFTPLKRSESI
jgi:hypothetical protein